MHTDTTYSTSSGVDPEELERRVAEMYRAVAGEAALELHFPIGRAVAEGLGYPAELLDRVPAEAVNSFAGVGYHLGLARPQPGERVLDLGRGSGRTCSQSRRWWSDGSRDRSRHHPRAAREVRAAAARPCARPRNLAACGLTHRLRLDRRTASRWSPPAVGSPLRRRCRDAGSDQGAAGAGEVPVPRPNRWIGGTHTVRRSRTSMPRAARTRPAARRSRSTPVSRRSCSGPIPAPTRPSTCCMRLLPA